MKAPRSFHFLAPLFALCATGLLRSQTQNPASASAADSAGSATLGQPKTFSLAKPPTQSVQSKPQAPLPESKVVHHATPPADVVEKAAAKAAEKTKDAKPTVTVKAATLGLPRFAAQAKSGAPAALTADKFEVDPLHVAAGAPGQRKGQQANVSYLALDPSAEWSRPLRGNPHAIGFISLNLHASVTTVIDAGGAWISVLASDTAGRVALMVGEQDKRGNIAWKKAGVEVPVDRFGGHLMGACPILTVRRDPDAGTWDLYSGLRQIAAGLPLVPDSKKNISNKITVRAGAEGAWLNAVAVSDENPLFMDVNANGVDDAFEVQKKGAILSTKATPAERQSLVQEWQKAQRNPTRPLPPVVALRPLPDRLAAEVMAKLSP